MMNIKQTTSSLQLNQSWQAKSRAAHLICAAIAQDLGPTKKRT